MHRAFKRWCASLVLAVTSLQLPVVARAAEEALSADDLLKRASAVHRSDDARFLAATGTGSWEITGADGVQRAACEFTFQRRGDLLFAELTNRNPAVGTPWSWQKLQAVADGKTLATGVFSERINPNGFTTCVYDDDGSHFGVATAFFVDPRSLLRPTLLDPEDPAASIRERGGELRIIEQTPTAIELRMQFPNMIWIRAWLSPEYDYRLSRLEVGSTSEEAPHLVHEYVWKETPHGMTLHRLTIRRHTPKGDQVEQLSLESYAKGCELRSGEFDLRALESSVAGSLLDRRKGTAIKVRQLDPEQLDPQRGATMISSQVSRLPDRYQKRSVED